MSTEEIKQLNNNENDQEILPTVEIPIDSQEEVSDDEYFSQFTWPEEGDDDEDNDWIHFYEDSNDDLMVNEILTRHQLIELDRLEEKNYQRSKRSHKKINAQRQIKSKHAQSIKHNSHNKHLYIHHRIYKQVQLDPPSRNFNPSSTPLSRYPSSTPLSRYPSEKPPAIQQQCIPVQTKVPPRPAPPVNQFREYTINELNLPRESSFDDAMVRFLLDMQNRDLCPEDYEMLLRLDERVQRKTMDKNIFNTLPTIHVDQTHLTDHCTICMEEYTLGQALKLLPCKHVFHTNCIETYLKDFSVQCPLDNLPLV